MYFLRKLLLIIAGLLLLATGLWLVVANSTPVTLDLFFLSFPFANLGLVVLASFAAGAAIGLLVGLNLLQTLKLRTQLYWLKREVRQLHDAAGDKR